MIASSVKSWCLIGSPCKVYPFSPRSPNGEIIGQYIAPCEGIQDSLGFWTPRRGFRILVGTYGDSYVDEIAWSYHSNKTYSVEPCMTQIILLSDDFTTKIWISSGIFIMATIKSGRVKLRLRSFLVTSVPDSLRKTRRIVRARIKPKTV